jgi:HEAT repeat protein
VVAPVAEMARAGNLRALQVLAGLKQPSAREPLTDIAAKAAGVTLQLALAGLAKHWAEQSVPLFKDALTNADKKIVSIAIRGLGKSKDPEAAPLLLPLLNSPDFSVKYSVTAALATVPPGPHAPKYLEAILSTTDPSAVASLSQALIKHKWNDPKTIPRLIEKLKQGKGDERYSLMQLLRHLSHDALGPATWEEYDQNPAGWVQQWVNWGGKK